METIQKINGEFAEMANGLQMNNKVMQEIAADAIVEEVMSNEEEVEKRPANRTGEHAEAPPVKRKRGPNTTMSTTLANARKFNANISKFEPAWLSNNQLIVLVALDAKADLAALMFAKVNEKVVLHGTVLKERYMLYYRLSSFGTRVLNELKASGASETTIEAAEHFVKKLRGRIIPIDPNEVDVKRIKASQLSFASQLQNFIGLITVVSGEVLYNPVLDVLKVGDLNLRADAMVDANAAVNVSQAELDADRRARNKCFNEPMIGLVDLYQTAKSSAKATYGVTSAEFASIKGIEFRRIEE